MLYVRSLPFLAHPFIPLKQLGKCLQSDSKFVRGRVRPAWIGEQEIDRCLSLFPSWLGRFFLVTDLKHNHRKALIWCCAGVLAVSKYIAPKPCWVGRKVAASMLYLLGEFNKPVWNGYSSLLTCAGCRRRTTGWCQGASTKQTVQLASSESSQTSVVNIGSLMATWCIGLGSTWIKKPTYLHQQLK